MNSIFKKHQALFLVQLAISAVVLFFLHRYLLNSLVPDPIFIIPLVSVYVFHVIAVFVVFTIINFRFSNGRTHIFNTFIALMILKMIFVVVFLLPLFFSTEADKVVDVINFFIPYFIFLAFEVYSVNGLLTQK
jgi:hypothetical protein